MRRLIADGLRARGVDVLRAQDDGMTGAADPVILERAGQLGRVVFTQDEDFLIEAHARQAAGRDFVGVIYAHKLTLSIGRCIEELELIAKVYEPQELANRVEWLPLK